MMYRRLAHNFGYALSVSSMNGINGSTIDGRVVFCASGTPACARTRRTVEWCNLSCRAIVPTGHLSA